MYLFDSYVRGIGPVASLSFTVDDSKAPRPNNATIKKVIYGRALITRPILSDNIDKRITVCRNWSKQRYKFATGCAYNCVCGIKPMCGVKQCGS